MEEKLLHFHPAKAGECGDPQGRETRSRQAPGGSAWRQGVPAIPPPAPPRLRAAVPLPLGWLLGCSPGRERHKGALPAGVQAGGISGA